MAFEIDSIKSVADDGAQMPVINPATGTPLVDKDGSPVSILVVGIDSRAYIDAVRKQRNVRFQRQQENRKTTAEMVEEDDLDLSVAVTLGWSGFTVAGADFAFTPENARSLYKKWPWMRAQVDEFAANRANFWKA